ncbi:MAG: helix-turn-helix domain-containing protein [Planctomycetota bacterium]
MTDTTNNDTPLAENLWTVKDAAAFLRKSQRWIFYALQTPEHESGSIPHSKLGRNPRFIPDDLRLWAAQGFPPANAFKTWKEADERRRRRTG